MYARRLLLLTLVVFASMALSFQDSPRSAAAPAATDPFARTWARTDQPVLSGAVSRTWMWGPEAFTDGRWEDYADSPGGQRLVQYFDKSRMEITNPDAVDDGLWYVTNGLLVVELMTGEMQTGNEARVQRSPAQINVAGDPDDPLTYAVLAQRRGDAPLSIGSAVTQRIDASGQVSDDPGLAGRNVTAATHVVETNHTVASVFWEFMHSSGLVQQGDQTVTDQLFVSPFYGTGYPITEAYWAEVKIGGTPHEVLLQCFERRCLTYAPQNPAGWQVEAGNVGQHYYRWRYPDAPPGPSAQANELAKAVTHATSDEDRYQALLRVMDALHVGVYSGDGSMLLGGAERGAADFYLYDVELQMMAAAIGRGQTWGVVDLAMQLTAMELLPEGETLDPELVRQALLRGIAAAAGTPQESTSLSPLIVRQLGLTQMPPYDLFDDVALAEIRLNALAYFLVLADIAVPLMQDQLPLPTGASSNLLAESNGVLKRITPAQLTICDPPEGFNGDAFKDAWGFGRIYAELVSLVPTAIAKGTVILDALHGAILAFSVGVTELAQRLETHYGHESPGQPITFRIKVEMRDELPDALVDCGWIAGTAFPPKGPIPGVSVHWFWDNLEEHGQIFCGNACPTLGGSGLSIDATGTDGIASMTFTPKTEENPGEGWVVEEHGIVTGVALYQSKFTNLMGSYAQYLTPKSGATRWVVEWHEPPGYNITMKVSYNATGAYNTEHYGEIVYTASGTATYEVRVPMDAVIPPHDWAVDPFTPTFTASGSGSFSLTNPTPGADNDCAGSWGGSFSGDTSYTTYSFPPDNVPVTLIQVNVPAPPAGNYSSSGGGCSGTGSPDLAVYVGTTRAVPTEINLDVRTPQTFVVSGSQMCANMGFDRCEGTSTWTVTVEIAGPPT